MTLPSVGVVGLGLMGSAAAGRLIDQGFQVVVANRTAGKAASFAQATGCQHSVDNAELARRCDVILVLTSGEEDTRSALLADDGVFAGIRAGAVVVVMSTVAPNFITEMANAASAAKGALFDAPISGRPIELAEGRVTIFIGGDGWPASVESVLSALGSVVNVGPLGSAAVMKLAVNTVVFGLVASIAEGVALAESAGVERGTAYDVLRGSAVASTFIDLRRPYFVDTCPPPVQFSMAATHETLELIVSAAERLGLDLPLTSITRETVAEAAGAGLGNEDITGLARFLTRRGR